MKYDHSGAVRRVLGRANAEASEVRHDYIGTEHILLALLREERGAAAEVLARLGVDAAQLRRKTLNVLRPGTSEKSLDRRPYTSRAKKVIEYAMAVAREEAAGAGGGKARVAVDTDHLLIGLIREEKGIAAKVLASFGVRSTVGGVAERFRGTPGESVWFLEIDAESEMPIYEQIVARTEEAVATGLLVPGERLPPVRDLADELGLAPGTVARAYSVLEQRGVLVTEGARGTRVAKRSPPSPDLANVEAALVDLLRPVAVAAYHMGAEGRDVHAALESAMRDIFD